MKNIEKFFYFFFIGIDLTLRIAEKCMKEDDPETEISNEDPLAWTTIHCPQDNVYMITTILLMKLHLCDVMNFLLKNLSYIKYTNYYHTLCLYSLLAQRLRKKYLAQINLSTGYIIWRCSIICYINTRMLCHI